MGIAQISNIYGVSAFIDDPRHFVWPTLNGQPTKLLGHRGEKAFLPEHTVASYFQAGLEGADFIEPDLGLTKDGVVVCHHDEFLSGLTNVADFPEFADRKRNYTWSYDKYVNTAYDWFIVDFTYEELSRLRVRQERYPWRPQVYNDKFKIATFAEYLDIIRNITVTLERPFGIITEIKSPKLYNRFMPYPRYFEDKVLAMIQHWGFGNNSSKPINIPKNEATAPYLKSVKPWPYNVKVGPAVIQSYDEDTIKYISKNSGITTQYLNEFNPRMFTPKGLDEVAKHSKIVSTWKDILVAGPEAYIKDTYPESKWDQKEIDRLGGFLTGKEFVDEAHKRGMQVSLYTFYDSHQDKLYLCEKDKKLSSPKGFCPKDKIEEFFYFFDLGVDLLFCEDLVESQELRIFYNNKLEAQQKSNLNQNH
ncbi:hypothetical protein H4219_003131 [Mycoemilia scoparia]|uniref:glycerophosphodiester phosphodiesterase n=1 Tax=Mycoemilia scoparia TaxID=417184 RepID=A0A9W7ZVR2_9FUNG|nr:hypothetical protein H4219_003131 [Mycoemilia scoparia]